MSKKLSLNQSCSLSLLDKGRNMFYKSEIPEKMKMEECK
jgi:hypothetical protein